MTATHPRDSVLAVVGDGFGSLLVHTTARYLGFDNADVTIFGAVPAEFVGTVARAYALTPDAALPLARLDAGSFGVLRRGRIEYVSLDPSGAEGRLLEAARASGAPPPGRR